MPTAEDLDALLERAQHQFDAGDPSAAADLLESAAAVARSLAESRVISPVQRVRVMFGQARVLSAAGETYAAAGVALEADSLVAELPCPSDDLTEDERTQFAFWAARHLAEDDRGEAAWQAATVALALIDGQLPDDPVRLLRMRASLLSALSLLTPESDDELDAAETDEEEPGRLTAARARRQLVETLRELASRQRDDVDVVHNLSEALRALAPQVAEEATAERRRRVWNDEDTTDLDVWPTPAVTMAHEAVDLLLPLADAEPSHWIAQIARPLATLAVLADDEGREYEAIDLIERLAARWGEPWGDRLEVMVHTWEWLDAPTFAREEDALACYEELLDEGNDVAIEAVLAAVSGAVPSRLRSIRAAARELGVAEAYEQRAADPVAFLLTYGGQ